MNAANEWIVPDSNSPAWKGGMPTFTTGALHNSIVQYPSHAAYAPAPTYGHLGGALAAAQGELHSAKKDTANPFFKSKYADLASVWEACRAALSKHGLAVVQTLDVQGERAQPVLKTMLIHKSGEFITSTYPIKPIKDDPQGVGSAITYARRYSLAAMVGVVADEDDDGEAATRTQKIASVTGEAQKKKPKWTPEQQEEGGTLRARAIACGAAAEKAFRELTVRMAYDNPSETLDALGALVREQEDIADQAKGGAK